MNRDLKEKNIRNYPTKKVKILFSTDVWLNFGKYI